MKKTKLILAGISILLSSAVSAREWVGAVNNNNTNANNTVSSRAASCAPATQVRVLDFNNVSALVENSGLLWMNRSSSNAAYFVPKDAGTSPLYAGALWLGGEDVNNQLKLAGTRFRSNGDDYWPGPLNGNQFQGNGQGTRPFGDASIDPATCLKWDKFYVITRQEVEEFDAWFTCSQDPTCDASVEFPGYEIPEIIKNWGDIAHGDAALGQDKYLAPFYDRDLNGEYDYNQGDYPWYDIKEEVDCRSSRQVTLFGDYTIWWMFNDKGNIHTETGGDPIGMEIRGQAFSFATNDEINNMTFYNYELINRSTLTLYNTYFGQNVDADLGCAQDDYVGCDVSRGLGFAYNADANDDNCSAGSVPYGANPPAIGVDFFEGPYQDNDGVANPYFVNGSNNFLTEAVEGNGIGYGDSIVDNERFGMRRFVYYNNTTGNTGDPNNFTQYYNYLRGQWQDGRKFVYGGTAEAGSVGATTVECDFMFPSDPATGVNSDPEGWGTAGNTTLPVWSEVAPAGTGSTPNPAGDRRFVQSAGPFTLEPGALNNITVGVVYGRGASGNLSSLARLKFADDKAQRLFDNCFQILEGPDAPKLTIQELDKELILTIDPYANGGDIESYIRKDPNIVIPADADSNADEFYRFEGYQIYQLKDQTVSVSEVYDVDKSRLVAQYDIKNGVTQLINYELDNSIGVETPQEMVNGADEGIKHSLRVTTDLFASGDTRLVNHKTYYYMVISYGYNNFKTFDPTDPNALDGQKKPYIPSRTGYDGKQIQAYPAIPHTPKPEAGGTVQNAEYGDGVEITRVEGIGNGGNALDLTDESRLDIARNYRMQEITYKAGKGPIDVKVVDPLNLIADDFEIWFVKDANNLTDSARWKLVRKSTGDTIESNSSIAVGNEQIFPEYGFSVTIEQYVQPIREVKVDPSVSTGNTEPGTELLDATIQLASGEDDSWFGGIPDREGNNVFNWIRSGTQLSALGTPEAPYNDWQGLDDEQQFEKIAGGIIAPFRLLSYAGEENSPVSAASKTTLKSTNALGYIRSVDIVLTPDKSLWSRCPVLETQDQSFLAEGGAQKLKLRAAPSVDKNGRKAGDAGYNSGEGDLVSTTGFGWFPGYAIDIETGERLNVAFGEDSYLAGQNGRDMLFNPTSTITEGLGNYVAGGKHFFYVFRNNETTPQISTSPGSVRTYDDGQTLLSLINNTNKLWGSCMYAGIPLSYEAFNGKKWLSSEVIIKIRVATPYNQYATKAPFFINNSPFVSSNPGGPSDYQNEWYGLYKFNTNSVATSKNVLDTAKSVLSLINVVPNPYYAYSNYESSRLDTRIKITNLPDKCTIKIFTVSGTLIRTFTKDDQTITSVDWDLKNYKGVPIASGVYIIHVNVPGVGDRVLKWFGSMRPPDLTNF